MSDVSTISGEQSVSSSAPANPATQVSGGLFGGLGGLFDKIQSNPVLLLIVMAVVILIIGKVM